MKLYRGQVTVAEVCTLSLRDVSYKCCLRQQITGTDLEGTFISPRARLCGVKKNLPNRGSVPDSPSCKQSLH